MPRITVDNGDGTYSHHFITEGMSVPSTVYASYVEYGRGGRDKVYDYCQCPECGEDTPVPVWAADEELYVCENCGIVEMSAGNWRVTKEGNDNHVHTGCVDADGERR